MKPSLWGFLASFWIAYSIYKRSLAQVTLGEISFRKEATRMLFFFLFLMSLPKPTTFSNLGGTTEIYILLCLELLNFTMLGDTIELSVWFTKVLHSHSSLMINTCIYVYVCKEGCGGWKGKGGKKRKLVFCYLLLKYLVVGEIFSLIIELQFHKETLWKYYILLDVFGYLPILHITGGIYLIKEE